MARAPQNDRTIYRDASCYVDTRIDPRVLLAIPAVSSYQVIDVTEYRPALVSFLIYGTPDYWWILLDYNQITFSQFVTGTTLRIPGAADIQTVLEQARKTRIVADGKTGVAAGTAPTRRIISV